MTKKIIFSIFVFILALAACSTKPKLDDGKFRVDLSSPQFPAGEIETQIDKPFRLTGPKKIAVAVSYFPFEDAVCLSYRSDFFAYRQFWSREGRETFLKSFEKYGADYADRNLDAGNKTSKKSYGAAEGVLAWQMLRFTRRVTAGMNMEFGYSFKERAPYYAVTQKMAFYEDAISKENNMTSQEITMYFTRAQAQELAALFDQGHLFSLIPDEWSGGARDLPGVDADEY
jgi:hypothetical protein